MLLISTPNAVICFTQRPLFEHKQREANNIVAFGWKDQKV